MCADWCWSPLLVIGTVLTDAIIQFACSYTYPYTLKNSYLYLKLIVKIKNILSYIYFCSILFYMVYLSPILEYHYSLNLLQLTIIILWTLKLPQYGPISPLLSLNLQKLFETFLISGNKVPGSRPILIFPFLSHGIAALQETMVPSGENSITHIHTDHN